VATSPKGFSKDNPAIELLKHKQFYLEKKFYRQRNIEPRLSKRAQPNF
jgi:Conserved hypothetical protein (DUF2461)